MNATPLLRSLLRIVVATVLALTVLVAGTFVIMRQPSLSTLPSRGALHAEPQLMANDVRFLTVTVFPRNASHPENLDRASEWIAESFRGSGARVTMQSFRVRGRIWRNVIAAFGPDDLKTPLLVVGAHYDAFGATGSLPGADDNASGTAGLLALGRLLGRTKLDAPVTLVAFTNEEPPFFGSDEMGSAAHAESLAAARRPVRGMICLEMIGYFRGRQAWPSPLLALLYPSKGDFIAVAGGWPDRHLTSKVKRAMASAGGIPVYSFTATREVSDASDQRNYWSHGWPAVMITDTAYLRNPNYHTARDTADTLDYVRMAHVVDGIFNVVLHAKD